MTKVATTLVSEATTMIIMVLIDNRKATSKHLSYIKGKCIISKATEQMKQDGIGKKSNNSLSASGFAVFKELIAKSGRIIFDCL